MAKAASVPRRVSARALAPFAVAIVLAAAVAVIAQPQISALVGHWEVESAFRSLRIPDGWSVKDAPVERMLSDGSVLMTAVYVAPLDATPSTRFVALESVDGWQVIGGAPDGSTVLLRRGDLSLSLATLPEHKVRLELARYR